MGEFESNFGGSSNSTIDHSRPYFKGSSDDPNSLIVTTPLDGNGLNSWNISIIISLSTIEKIGIR